MTGRALLSSYVINNRPLPGTDEASPVIALVTLEEGPRMLTNIVGVEPDPAKIKFDMPVNIVIKPVPQKDKEGNSYLSYFFEPRN